MTATWTLTARRSIWTADDGRAITPLLRDGQAFGFISHDPAVLADPLLVEAVATAAALTSANARLQADAERQAAEVRASRRRIVTAGLEERRRLEADLRVGPGARLDRVAALLDDVPDRRHVGRRPRRRP